ncbi:hypothetical protein ACIGJO_03325 [Streptomyces sp. NPDC079020]|uniref:hypothetical protein n=1 Tax=Streptomyces sp. NPDC079020 TaxID=3365722 RepID=UPI0037D8C681
MTGQPFTHLPVRLALTAGAAALLLQQYARRITQALTPQPPAPRPLFTELQRIETDPAHRARFLTALDAAILRRDAEHTAEVHAVEAAAHLLHRHIHPGPGQPTSPGPRATATTAAPDTAYIAEITMTTGTAPHPVPLGRITAPNRRLALRWLRTQALRLADAHGHPIPPETATWTHASHDVRPVTFHGTDAPEALRTWATHDHHQAHALHHLETSPHTPLLTATDPATGLHIHLTTHPAQPDRATTHQEEPCLSSPRTSPHGAPTEAPRNPP